MTDSEKFTLIEKVKKDIQNMGFSVNITHGVSIRVSGKYFIVNWKKDENYNVWNLSKVDDVMDQEQWENYAAEIDNLNRAIFWVNTQIKSIVFE